MANWRINDIITKIKTNYSRRLLLVLVESRKLLELAKITEQIYVNGPKARIFLLDDLQEFFSDLGSGGLKKKKKL